MSCFANLLSGINFNLEDFMNNIKKMRNTTTKCFALKIPKNNIKKDGFMPNYWHKLVFYLINYWISIRLAAVACSACFGNSKFKTPLSYFALILVRSTAGK